MGDIKELSRQNQPDPLWQRIIRKLWGQKFYSREERAQYVLHEFGDFLSGRVLDVGSGGAGLCSHVRKCTSIDIDPTSYPDVFVNLEQASLPFSASSFDCIVCTDVLEHLENNHLVFAELVRVTKGFILISLPNNWLSARKAIRFGSLNRPLKYYGLPLDPPNDRHRWFFSYAEAEAFLFGMSNRFNLKVRQLYPYFGKRNQVMAWILSPFLTQQRIGNLYASSVWVVFEKVDSA